MKVSTKGRYALRLMLDVASNSTDETVALKDVSTRQEISEKYLERIVGNLVKAGLLVGQRGGKGGYKLVKSPADYTVGEILAVTESSVAPVACTDSDKDGCNRCDTCVTSQFWKGLDRVVDDYLYGTTLQNLLDKTCHR
ncbi:MAG: Rrf2 family transcriptional regulator [Clostridia bacterium]|nr:Rrf2 family transcriptional regulator [Clostridia bacterium]